MRNPFQNITAFILGFTSGLLLFAAFNLFAIQQTLTDLCHHCIGRIGFPFPFYEGFVFGLPERVLWFGLAADIFIALVFSFATGFILKIVWSMINNHRSQQE